MVIPGAQKDPEGYWYGDYYGVLAFEINADIVKTPPRDWPDLLKGEYKNAVALAGDPRASNQAIQGVFAAGLAAAKGDVGKAGDAYAAIAGGAPPWVRPTLMTFSGVASNFAGVPLAFAFLATLGRTGIVTALLVNLFGFRCSRT